MSKFIEITDGQDGKIIWIENSGGEACGICHDQTVIDEDGLPSCKQEMGANVFLVLENSGFELEQDWDNEQTFINLKDSNGEDCKLVFSGSSIEIVND
tara:strand:- start:217 stop:510 length:294 start_codon:yes stop_codon:yes gene_type:complete